MIQSPRKVLWVGCGTKTGKTTAAAIWIAEGILKHEPCAWIGPWSSKTRDGYTAVKGVLNAPIRAGAVRCNDSNMRIWSALGGGMEPHTGDNPDAIFGGAYKRIVIDEASRQSESSYTAAWTTASPRSVQGKIRVFFNLEHGAQNWAVKKLLEVKGMTDEQRATADVDYMMFPTLSEDFVSHEDVELARQNLPDVMFRALYLAEIPAWDTSIFRNIDGVFSAAGFDAPTRGHSYVMGVDLARKQNWTVATVIDAQTKQAVDAIRFNEISWTLQYSRIADLYKKWGCSLAAVDATGIGDPVVEELARRGMRIDPVIFVPKVRKELVELLIVAFDQQEIRVTSDERFEPFRDELIKFEPRLNRKTGEVTYGASAGWNDDCVFSLALAWRCLKLGNFGPTRISRGDTSRLHVSDLAAF